MLITQTPNVRLILWLLGTKRTFNSILSYFKYFIDGYLLLFNGLEILFCRRYFFYGSLNNKNEAKERKKFYRSNSNRLVVILAEARVSVIELRAAWNEPPRLTISRSIIDYW